MEVLPEGDLMEDAPGIVKEWESEGKALKDYLNHYNKSTGHLTNF